MFIKIYFGNKPLYLCDKIEQEIEPFIHHDDAVFIDELNSHTIKSMIHEMENPSVHAGVFFHPELDELKKAFWKKFTVIKAGGGIVTNEGNQILIIFRKGKWDLPKGKLDDGETIKECAVREVSEETAIRNINLESYFITTYHTYHEGSKHILKESHWFTMTAPGNQKLEPQKEEGIDIVQWMKASGIKKIFPETFPSVVDVLTKYLQET